MSRTRRHQDRQRTLEHLGAMQRSLARREGRSNSESQHDGDQEEGSN